jgi:hypothetical protein
MQKKHVLIAHVFSEDKPLDLICDYEYALQK